MRSGTKARRLLSRPWSRSARRALMAAGLWLAGTAADVHAQTLTAATFGDPTRRYAHGVLGDAVEYGSLKLQVTQSSASDRSQDSGAQTTDITIRLPLDHVFEDLQPRLVDVTGDGHPEAMVVETDVALGGQLAIYDATGAKIAETPHIGRTNRWLAPVGAADLDGDGYVEVAYIDRPHLAKTLRIWRYRDGALHPVADLPGLTNHRIGEDFITSGIRDCGQGPEMITADAGWRQVMASRLVDGQIETRAIGPFRSPADVSDALNCS